MEILPHVFILCPLIIDNTMIKKLVLLLVIMFLFFPHINAQNEPKNKDSIVVKNVDVYVEYCLSNDATIEFAIKNNIPIHYPILIINDEIISDENDIDIIRNTVTHTRKLCGITVCNRLGPYRIKRIMRYSSSQAEKKRYYCTRRSSGNKSSAKYNIGCHSSKNLVNKQ